MQAPRARGCSSIVVVMLASLRRDLPPLLLLVNRHLAAGAANGAKSGCGRVGVNTENSAASTTLPSAATRADSTGVDQQHHQPQDAAITESYHHHQLVPNIITASSRKERKRTSCTALLSRCRLFAASMSEPASLVAKTCVAMMMM